MGDGTSELKGCSCGGALDDFEEGSMPHFRTKGSEEDYDFVPVEWPYTGQTQVLGLESVLKQFLFAGVVYDFKAVLTALTSKHSGGKNWKRIHGKGKYYFKTPPDDDGLLSFTPGSSKAAFEGAEEGPFPSPYLNRRYLDPSSDEDMQALKTALGNIPAAALKHESAEKTAEKIKALLSTFHFVPRPPPSTEITQPSVSASNGSAADVGGQENLPRLLAVPAEAAANKALLDQAADAIDKKDKAVALLRAVRDFTTEFAAVEVDRILRTRPTDLCERDAIIRAAILAAQVFDNVEHVQKRQKT